MKELQFLEIIKKTLNNSSFIGDDCAFLDDKDIFVTHDTLVQDVHFSLYTTTPYLLGRKAVCVNLSDLAAALSKPEYITVSLSMPKLTKESFVSELYRGINDVCNEFNLKVIGGDITGSDKIIISICAIGKKQTMYMSSRKYAKKGDVVLVTGSFGKSAAGLHSLTNFLYADKELTEAHLNPVPRLIEAKRLADITDTNITVMDCSDGLADALYKIAIASSHNIKIDINRVPICEKVKEYCNVNNIDCNNLALWGGEDYELLICTSEEQYSKLDENVFKYIGTVQNKDNSPCVIIENGNTSQKITKEIFEKQSFNHFSL